MSAWDLDYLLRNEESNEVVVLGAGFSHAVDKAFPLTDGLGQLATLAAELDLPMRRERGIYQMSLADLEARLPEENHQFIGGTFETWMSYLAEPQPFLGAVERAVNHARFLRFVRSIWEVLTLVEVDVAHRGVPAWFYRLLSALHARRATIVSFNYDRLVEEGLEHLQLQDFSHRRELKVRWHSPLFGIPSPPPIAGLFGEDPIETARLCKLHGSLNWYWVPGDATGQTLNRWIKLDQTSGLFTRMPGREPFVVPPTSAKSTYFASPVLSEIWRRAHDALENASSVDLVGYSLPLTDLTAAGMVSKTLTDREMPIRVVNPSPDSVQSSLKTLIGRAGAEFPGVREYADDYVAQASVDLANRIHHAQVPEDTRLLIGWNWDLLSKALSVRRDKGGVVISVGDCDGWATAVVQGECGLNEDRMARHFRELQPELRPGDQIDAEFPNGQRTPLVGIDGFETESGASSHWQVLVPADLAESIGVRYTPAVGVPT